ncbi:hypothetical protein NEAUS04_1472 [Nematocida ausubeli]|nr:hypothetical protein NEAUS04_1472 [Nematocida ausubeli]
MNIYRLIKLLTLSVACGKITKDDLKAIQQIKIAQESSVTLAINPTGPLTMLFEYISHIAGFMHNKRFFSPEIKTCYTLEMHPVSTNPVSRFNSKFERSPVDDKAYQTESLGSKTPKYVIEYHKRLINMFPSATGDLSIQAGRPDALTRFLKAESVSFHAPDILAALFLLSEGVDIDIKIETVGGVKSLVLRKRNGQDEHFRVNMRVMEYNWNIKKEEEVFHSETAEIISFFIRNTDSSFLKVNRRFSEPKSFDQFVEGHFLDTPSFLIQSYIFEFMNNAAEVEKLIRSVYNILHEYVSEPEGKQHPISRKLANKAQKVFNSCFMPEESCPDKMEYLDMLQDIQKAVSIAKVFPFSDASQLPSYIIIPVYRRKEKKFCTQKKFSNCVETCLLSLFCCLAYDISKDEYTTEHIESASDHLKRFFSTNYKPFESTDFQMHLDWCKVVSDLDCPDIDYTHERNEIQTGLLNILCLILKITGRSQEERNTISQIIKALNAGIDPAVEIYSWLKEYMQYLFQSLFKSGTITVCCSSLYKAARAGGKIDIFGTISISSVFNGIENKLELNLTYRHTDITVLPQKMVSSCEQLLLLESIEGKLVQKNNKPSYLLRHYVHIMTEKFKLLQITTAVDRREEIMCIKHNRFREINKLLMLGKIYEIQYKKELFACILMYALDENLTLEHPELKLALNILGSTPLSDFNTQITMMPSLKYSGIYKLCSDQIRISEEGYNSILTYTSETNNIFSYVLDMNDPEYLLSFLEAFMQIEFTCAITFSPLKTAVYTEKIFDFICRNSCMDCIEKIDGLIEKHWKKDKKMKESLHASWFFYACNSSNPMPSLIVKFYGMLNQSINTIHFMYTNRKTDSKNILEVINGMKDTLCSLEGGRIKFDNVLFTISRLQEIR